MIKLVFARDFYEVIEKSGLEGILEALFKYNIVDHAGRSAFAVFGIDKNNNVIPLAAYGAEYYVQKGSQYAPKETTGCPMWGLYDIPKNSTLETYKGKLKDVVYVISCKRDTSFPLLLGILKHMGVKKATVLIRTDEGYIAGLKLVNANGKLGMAAKADLYFKKNDKIFVYRGIDISGSPVIFLKPKEKFEGKNIIIINEGLHLEYIIEYVQTEKDKLEPKELVTKETSIPMMGLGRREMLERRLTVVYNKKTKEVRITGVPENDFKKLEDFLRRIYNGRIKIEVVG